MPYKRETLLESPLVGWSRVALTRADEDWSEEYRVVTPRWVLPQRGGFACSVGRAHWECSPRAAVWLAPRQAYRMRRQLAGQLSWVIALPGLGHGPRRRELRLADHLELALLRAQCHAGRADPLQAQERLVGLALSLLEREAFGAGAAHPAVERARQYLAAHFARQDRLEDIARAAAASPFHLARTFRRQTGTSIHAYRDELRLAEGLRRIAEGQANLAALALDLGYASHAHFSAVFRRALGSAPNRMRRILVAQPR